MPRPIIAPDGSLVSPVPRRLRNPRREAFGKGLHKSPRSALQSGAITRREWLRFLRYCVLGKDCLCGSRPLHYHWLWIGSLDSHGYGHFQWRGRLYQSYRFSYIALRGSIPPGLEPDHLCRIPRCCNPDCLEIVTKAENNRRGESICAQHTRQTHCKHGHLLAGDNLYAPRLLQGHRVCNICLEAKRARHESRRRAALEARGPLPQRTHCKRGHLFTEENLQPYEWRVLGQRVCRLCVRDRERSKRKEI